MGKDDSEESGKVPNKLSAFKKHQTQKYFLKKWGLFRDIWSQKFVSSFDEKA
jgi:hypothetical protein